MADKPPGEKTEAPSPKRQADARKKGDIARSRELGVALVTLFGAGYLALMGAGLVDACAASIREGFAAAAHPVDFDPARTLVRILEALALPVGGLLLTCCAGALAGGMLLGGLSFNLASAAPKLSRMNPIAGLGRMFGSHGLTELGKALMKLVVVGAVAWWAVGSLVADFPALARADPLAAIGRVGDRAAWLLLALAGGLVLIALADAPLALFRHLAKLRMSKQELKDEYKEQEGSPELKGARRQRQRELSRGATAAAVATANVVLVNPSRFAVALRYRRAEDPAPVVVARGRGQIAAAIRAAAAEHALPILEYPTLARALYFTSRRGTEIHPDLYVAVAAILAFVFNLDRRARAPEVEIPPALTFDQHGRAAA